MADILAALVALAKADVATAALVGSGANARVFGAELPPEEAAQMPRHAIVIRPSGGAPLTARSFAHADAQRVDLLAYGPTPGAADALRRLAARQLRNVRRAVFSGVLIHWINSAGGFALTRDADGQWPVSFQSFQVFHSLEEIS